jgi:hypothetical protein
MEIDDSHANRGGLPMKGCAFWYIVTQSPFCAILRAISP